MKIHVCLAVLAMYAVVAFATGPSFTLPIIKADEGPNVYQNYQFECFCGAPADTNGLGRATGTCLDVNNGYRGCTDETCCKSICSYDRGQCCTSDWDEECVKLALWKPECTYKNTFCEASSYRIGFNAVADFFVYHHNFHGATHQNFRSCHLIGASVWYKFYSPLTHHLQIDVCNTTFDNVMVVYETDGNCPTSDQQCVEGGCVDDCKGDCNFGSIADYWTNPGKTYWIQLGGFDASRGYFGLKIREEVGYGGRVWYQDRRLWRWEDYNSNTEGVEQLTDWDQNALCTATPDLTLDGNYTQGDVSIIPCTGRQALVYFDAANDLWTPISVIDMTAGAAIGQGCIQYRVHYNVDNNKLYWCDNDVWEVIVDLTMDPAMAPTLSP
mmetsp:Transcript_94301/g.131002  ORF Transcript_94301/g.131002 Transcript_94301/m.131002 type:complete len:383 (+) Transcript_94301:99-1247(+)